jgi:carboxymethylenebutenolidase
MRTAEVEQGFLAHPDAGAHPGVVMVPDVWGLSDHYRDLARRLAAEGYAVLAANPYRRMAEVRVEQPGRWIRSLSDPEVLALLQEGIDLLAAHPAVGGKRIGITGFCMGGQYALLAAAGCSGLSAAVPYYGLLSHEHGLLAPEPGERLDPARKPRSPLEAAAAVRCPVLGLFGADDAFVPVDDVRALERALAGAGHASVVSLYAGAGHAFMNETRPEMHRPEIAREAWGRMLAWLRRHLSE